MAGTNQRNSNPLIGVIGLVLFLFIAFFAVKSIVWVLGWIAPVLLLLTFIMDRKVITDYGKWIMNLFQQKWYYGVGAGAMTFFGFPFVSAFLFGKAMLKKKFNSLVDSTNPQRENETEFTDFEEVESEITFDEAEIEEDLKLPEIEENLNTLDDDSAYENLFDNEK